MDNNINGLPDELLVRILTLVPTKKAVSTSILSSRWKFLWMWLPKLDYTGRNDSLLVLRDFINKNLPLHRAPVIESLRLDLCELSDPHITPQDIKLWVEIAVARHVRKLAISCYPNTNENMLPSSLFTCKSLVTLKLRSLTLVDVPTMVCLPSLKTLRLDSLTYADNKSFQALLSICPVLEELDVQLSEEDEIQEFTVIVPSLLKLSLYIHAEVPLDRYEIDTPSLEYLKVRDWNECPCLFKSMPKLREAHLDIHSFAVKNVIGSVTSVKHLAVCSEDLYGGGIGFDQLEHLELCVCTDYSSHLLAQFLEASPNLRVLDMSPLDLHGDLRRNEMVIWNQPSCVPECLLSSLQIFKWGPYFGRPEERDIAVYILKNARQLRTVTIWANEVVHDVPALEMVKELTLSSRASSTCELVFIE